MIIKGGSRSNRRFFQRHLLNPKDNDKVRICEMRGWSHQDVGRAFLDMEIMSKATRCENYFYHADMSPRENEILTDEQWARATDILEEKLGLQGQPRFVIEHEKEGRTHRHAIWLRVNPDSMRAISDSLSYRKHEAAARDIEREMGLEPVASVLVKDREGPRALRRPKDYEGFRASQTGLKAEQVTREVTELFRQCDTGVAFQTALAERGYALCQGDRVPFCVVDPAGKEHSLTRRIEGANAAEVYGRLKDLIPDTLPTVQEARQGANAWASRSDAARAVQAHEMKRSAREWVYAARSGGIMHVNRDRDEWQDPSWSGWEQSAAQYGETVKNAERGLQDAYWQAMHGVRRKTEADKWHDLVMGRKEPELER